METAVHGVQEDITRLEAEIRDALDRGVVLSGRRFRRQTAVTFERNTHTAKAARDTGLGTVGRRFDPIHDDVDDRIEGLILDAFANGTMYRFLACALCEDETPWTPSLADRSAAFFRELTDPVDQATVYEIASWVLLDFFLNAGGSWRIFLKYLSSLNQPVPNRDDRETAGDENEEMHEPQITRREIDRALAAMPTLASGMPLSGPLPVRPVEIPPLSFDPPSAMDSSTTSRS